MLQGTFTSLLFKMAPIVLIALIRVKPKICLRSIVAGLDAQNHILESKSDGDN